MLKIVRLSAWTIQLRRNIAAAATLSDLIGLEPRTSLTDAFTTQPTEFNYWLSFWQMALTTRCCKLPYNSVLFMHQAFFKKEKRFISYPKTGRFDNIDSAVIISSVSMAQLNLFCRNVQFVETTVVLFFLLQLCLSHSLHSAFLQYFYRCSLQSTSSGGHLVITDLGNFKI